MSKFTSTTALCRGPLKPRQKKEQLPVESQAFTIPEFCLAHKLSRAGYYALKAKGQGPDETQFTPRGKITVSKESAQKWRAERLEESVAVKKVKPTAPPAAPTEPEETSTKAKPARAIRRTAEARA
jgi:hypothetical protein